MPTNPLHREAVPETPNRLGIEGIEFIEYTTSHPQALGQVLENMGFKPVARHRSREVTLYRQGGMNLVVNANPEDARMSGAADGELEGRRRAGRSGHLSSRSRRLERHRQHHADCDVHGVGDVVGITDRLGRGAIGDGDGGRRAFEDFRAPFLDLGVELIVGNHAVDEPHGEGFGGAVAPLPCGVRRADGLANHHVAALRLASVAARALRQRAGQGRGRDHRELPPQVPGGDPNRELLPVFGQDRHAQGARRASRGLEHGHRDP